MDIQQISSIYGEEITEEFFYSFHDMPMSEIIALLLKYIPSNELERMINAFP